MRTKNELALCQSSIHGISLPGLLQQTQSQLVCLLLFLFSRIYSQTAASVILVIHTSDRVENYPFLPNLINANKMSLRLTVPHAIGTHTTRLILSPSTLPFAPPSEALLEIPGQDPNSGSILCFFLLCLRFSLQMTMWLIPSFSSSQ